MSFNNFLAGPLVQRDERNGDEILGFVGKTGAKVLVVGGFRVLRHGMDLNGNHCIWVTYPYREGRARKIQTNGNLPEVNRQVGRGKKRGQLPITRVGADEIIDYCKRYLWPERSLKEQHQLTKRRARRKALAVRIDRDRLRDLK